MMRDVPLHALARLMGWRMVGHIHAGAWAANYDRLPVAARRIVRTQLVRLDALIVLTPMQQLAVRGEAGLGRQFRHWSDW